jgi:hypothetical protein
MKPWPSRLLFLAGAAAIAVAIPAIGQEQTPESLLPPGFGDPEAPLPPREEPPSPDRPPSGFGPPGDRPEGEQLRSIPLVEDSAQEDLEDLEELKPPPQPELPAQARRSPAIVGPLGPDSGGLAENAWGNANGRFLSTLMRRLDAPLPSRWTSMLLRRALLSRVPTPSHVTPADWVAERAWLLLRMGEADAARMLVQAVDVDRFTPKMFSVAVQTALATSDPAGLCPLVGPGRETSDEPVWPLAEAMCAALAGDAAQASLLIDRARARSRAGGIDLLLAEKIIGAGANTRRAVTIQWDEVDSINAWRFGLATAAGVEIPERLMNTAGAHVRAWQARAPMLPLEQRVGAAQTAASLGVFSSASLVEMHSLIFDGTDPSEIRGSIGERLLRAYRHRDIAERMEALRGLWDEGDDPVQRHARWILTAGASARILPSAQLAGDADDLIASMLTAGMDAQAARWFDVVAGMEAAEGDRAWALFALSSPNAEMEVSLGRVRGFYDRDDSSNKQRGRLLFAALAGLGRIEEPAGVADDFGIDLGRRTPWTQMLDRAVQSRQPGLVALLAAAGMQTGSWTGVPADHFYHMIRALRMAGFEYEARMIAAEAISRL